MLHVLLIVLLIVEEVKKIKGYRTHHCVLGFWGKKKKLKISRKVRELGRLNDNEGSYQLLSL